MSPGTTVRDAARFVSPLLYGASCVFVFVAGAFVASSTAVVLLLEALPGGSYLLENAVLSAVLLIVACTLMFAVLDLTTYRLEGSRRPGLRDHARHCTLLYAGIALVLCALLTILDLEAGMLQYDLGLALCAVAAYGILVDAVVALSMRRLTRTQPRDIT